MVMATEPRDDGDAVEAIEPVEPDTEVAEPEAPPEGEPEAEPTGDTPVVTEGQVSTPTDTVSQQVPQQAPPTQSAPQVDQRSVDELRKYQQADVQREWKEKVGKTARAYEQQLNDAGYMPEQSRDQARRYVQQEQKFRQQETETAEMVGYVQGKQAAAVHFMKKHGLANQQMLNDLAALQAANTPGDMEREAQRMKRERGLVAENARLKQGRVAPQTFDNSQGSAEATSNQDRLLDAYIAGDRSDAAVKAAQRLSMGN
jgi:hypothetical protein